MIIDSKIYGDTLIKLCRSDDGFWYFIETDVRTGESEKIRCTSEEAERYEKKYVMNNECLDI